MIDVFLFYIGMMMFFGFFFITSVAIRNDFYLLIFVFAFLLLFGLYVLLFRYWFEVKFLNQVEYIFSDNTLEIQHKGKIKKWIYEQTTFYSLVHNDKLVSLYTVPKGRKISVFNLGNVPSQQFRKVQQVNEEALKLLQSNSADVRFIDSFGRIKRI